MAMTDVAKVGQFVPHLNTGQVDRDFTNHFCAAHGVLPAHNGLKISI
jgi:hypothetical protein